jgi:hypothetical protein
MRALLAVKNKLSSFENCSEVAVSGPVGSSRTPPVAAALVFLEGIGGKKNEVGTCDAQSTELLLPFASLLTSVNNGGSKI